MTHKSCRAVLLALMAIQVVTVGLFWAWELPLPHRVEGGESPVLTAVLLSKSGQPLYTHATGLPLIQNPYGPVFEWLCAGFPATEAQPYLVGRAVSLLALSGIGLIVAYWLRRHHARWVHVLLAISLLLTTKPWILFGPLYRVDTLAVFLSVLGFSLVALGGRAGVLAALPVFTLAVSVKLTALAAPIAAVAYLWTTDRKRALWLLGGIGVLLPGSVLALQWLTDGAYLFNASLGNLPSHWVKGIDLPSRVSLSLFWLAAVVLAIRHFGLPSASRTRTVALYALTSWVLAGLFATNPLSSWNYLMESYVALSILTGLLLVRLDRSDPPHAARTRILALLTVHAAVSLLVTSQTIWKTSREILSYQTRYEDAYSRIAPLVRDGRTILVLDSQEGRDVLNALGKPNGVSVPPSVERRPDMQALIQRSLAHSDVDLILAGPELESRKPLQEPEPPDP